MNRYWNLTAAALVVALLSGCSPDAPDQRAEETTAVVNDENCKLESIKKIRDEKARQKFADACARRGGFKSSTGKTY